MAAIVVSLLLVVSAGNVAAGPINITNITGGWVTGSVTGGTADVTNTANQGTDMIRWPAGDSAQSGLDMTPGADILSAPLGSAFLLGSFVHINQPTGGTVTGVDYTFGFDTNGVPASLSDTFHFTVNDTPNINPCGFPSVSFCDDFITVSSVNLNSLITVGGDTYYFNLLGFSQDGGATISTVFQTQEGMSNHADLYGVVTSQPITAPDAGSSLLLLGMGLAGLAAWRQRRP
jgi:hypothetical protein